MELKSISLSLPQEIVLCLSRAEIYTADLIFDLCRYTSKKQKSGAFYSCVGQKFLAERVGVTREWISRCVNKLERLGILRITRRRKINEQWQTNLYRVGDAMKLGWKTMKSRFLRAKFRVKFKAHRGTKEHISNKDNRSIKQLLNKSPTDSFDSVMAKMQKRIDSWSK